MPELPEVETTLRGIFPYVSHQKITDVIVRHHQLRWPIPVGLKNILCGQTINNLTRRGKYLLFQLDSGALILHLGMSGRVRILTEPLSPQKHDHVDIHFANHHYLRFTDPRRFGALLWTSDNPDQHPLLKSIGPEPLTDDFNSDYLWKRAQNRRVCVKTFIMNSHIVAGVGNIYAIEALFAARIHPQTLAGKVTRAQYKKLVAAIKNILQQAIEKGGTTLKDFKKSDGSPGYFAIELMVYGRGGQPCLRCQTKLKLIRQGQRSMVYCPKCQPLAST